MPDDPVVWIQEDGQLRVDWDKIMNDGLPDDQGHGEYTKSLGRRTWNFLRDYFDNYGCHACKHAGQVFISGIHDMVNIHLGKPVYDESRWREFLEMVEKAQADSHTHFEMEHEILA